jgi:hypothetical protein
VLSITASELAPSVVSRDLDGSAVFRA